MHVSSKKSQIKLSKNLANNFTKKHNVEGFNSSHQNESGVKVINLSKSKTKEEPKKVVKTTKRSIT